MNLHFHQWNGVVCLCLGVINNFYFSFSGWLITMPNFFGGGSLALTSFMCLFVIYISFLVKIFIYCCQCSSWIFKKNLLIFESFVYSLYANPYLFVYLSRQLGWNLAPHAY